MSVLLVSLCQMCQNLNRLLQESFVHLEEQPPLLVSGDSGRLLDRHHIELFCVSVSSAGSIVEAGQSDPICSAQPSLCLVSTSALLRSRPGTPLSHPPFSNHTPQMLHWSRKNNQLAFCFSAASTGENKLMEMKAYRALLRRLECWRSIQKHPPLRVRSQLTALQNSVTFK